ncbi:hypothetical protein QBC43DRAFT_318558 [Cladorrhinum sp. PSN259]|nr:hypothetical protein QBC43DRAFT_318558 [Cladorrhinum sp. PSN259]
MTFLSFVFSLFFLPISLALRWCPRIINSQLTCHCHSSVPRGCRPEAQPPSDCFAQRHFLSRTPKAAAADTSSLNHDYPAIRIRHPIEHLGPLTPLPEFILAI